MFKKILFVLVLCLATTHSAFAYTQVLNNVVIKSKANLKQAVLDSRLEPYLGKEIDIMLLQSVLDEITDLYKTSGFLGAQAYYPEQESVDGSVVVYVTTAKLSELKINNLGSISNQTIYKLLSKVRYLQGQEINTTSLNTELLKVKDLNAFDMAGYFENSSSEPGAVDLNLDIKPKSRLGFQAMFDNYGNDTTGTNRFVGIINSHNLTTHADSAYFGFARTSKDQKNFNLEYALPVNTRLNVLNLNLSYGNYDVPKHNFDLDFKGNLFSFDMNVKEPLSRTSDFKSDVYLGTNYKIITDKIPSFDVELKRHSFNAYTKLSIVNYFDSLQLKHALKVNYGKIKAKDDYNYNQDYDFFITYFDSNLAYSLSKYLSVENDLSMQLASTSLDSSDKFSPCGAYGVQAYQSNVASSDSGLFDALTLRAKIHSSPSINLFTNFMQAHAQNNSGDTESFYGLGFGTQFMYQNFFIETSVNKPIGHNKIYAKDTARFLIKFGYIKD